MQRELGEYAIQSWFGKAAGRFELDLAESGIQPCVSGDLDLPRDLLLDYGPGAGGDELRSAIAGLYGVDPGRVIVTHGSQEALFLFYSAYLRAGDHVIAFMPGWQQAWEVPAALGANVSCVRLRADAGYRIDWEEVERVVRRETRLIVFTSPHNPTGNCFDTRDRERIAELGQRGIRTVVDEDYLADLRRSFACTMPAAISACSLSKLYGFPGLRIGWAVVPDELAPSILNHKRYLSICNSILCEHLGLQVLRRRDEFLARYARIRDAGLVRLASWVASQGLTMLEAANTPFAYVRFETSVSSQAFAETLLERQRVLVVPAEVFGDERALRISFGRPEHVLVAGLERIATELARCR